MVDILRQQKEFTKLLETHIGILLKISAVYSRTTQDRQDLLDEMVYQLWKSYATFEGRSSPSTWIYRVALNTALTKVRHDRRDILISYGETSPNWDQHIISEDPTLRDMYDQLYDTIEMLNDLDKAIILLYLDRHSYEQIGQVIGITSSNVGTRISRIKQQLKILVRKK